jgi:hypothetical protein
MNFSTYSFSGCDFKVLAIPYGGESSVELETLVTISFSTVHSKSPARSLGYNYPRGYTNTVSEIRGTMIFNMHRDYPLKGLETKSRYTFKDDYKRNEGEIRLGGEMEPFDLKLIGVTESDDLLVAIGKSRTSTQVSSIEIYGVEITGSGKVVSVHNVLTEKTYSFVARGFREFGIVTENKLGTS